MKALLCTLLCLMSIPAAGQRRFSGAVSAGTGIALSQPSTTPFEWQIAGYYNPGRRVSAGIGAGLSFYEKTLIPLFADAKFRFTRPRRFTPYIGCAAGYAFAPARDTRGGLYLNPSLGVEYALRSGPRLFLAAGYELQKFEQCKSTANDYFTAEFAERISRRALSLRIGILF